ncbi:OmpA family protein [Hyphomicrobium sp. LHD-15]|uniref:OmpA family protein n=1 Tax=Hyphomicrobium sp. LHD-15 TaxID=3072142 RepID=UPI00280E1A28|nr:OmpA family protein [Hyphomicrobium sp. LHD-15]MDQ8697701.1 OmpA family protein [Hyphomicrobium sp. LHD-15]
MTLRPFSVTLPVLAAFIASSSVPALAGRVLPPDQAQQDQTDDGQGKDKKGKPPQEKEGKRNKEGNRNDGRGKGQDGGPPRRDAGPGQDQDGSGKARNPDAVRSPEKQRARDDALRVKRDPEPQNFIQRRQLQVQQAKEAKEKALKDKQDADRARQDAARQKQLENQQAKEKAVRQKQDADLGRQNAERQKQLEIQQSKDKDFKQRQDSDFARQKAEQQKQFEIQQAKERAARENAARDQGARDQAGRDKAARDNPRDNSRGEPGKGQNWGGRPDRFPGKFDRAKADKEFERARIDAQRQRNAGPGPDRSGDTERWRDGSDRKFEAFRRGRKERDVGNRNLIIEPDKRVIVRHNDRAFIRHDESSRLQKTGRELRRERRKDGTLMIVTMGLAGALIYSLQDDDGRTLRRSRKDRDGREVVLFDNRRYYSNHGGSQFGPDRYYDNYVDLPPPDVRIPRDQYIVDYDRASPDDIYDALNAPPVERLERGYSLDEVRRSYPVLERMRRVDLDTINFEFGSWDVGPDQYDQLERIAGALRRIIKRSPEEVFLIEGHTDAVGSDIDNLSLSDRRAETVAVILSENFGIPPENLTTQGYGEQYLKVLTDGPSRINRRVSLRRITPLLSREGWNDDWESSSR